MTLFEPCARVDGGINILRDGKVIWESPALDNNCDFDNPAPNPRPDSSAWREALLLCDALALIEKADQFGYELGFKEGRS